MERKGLKKERMREKGVSLEGYRSEVGLTIHNKTMFTVWYHNRNKLMMMANEFLLILSDLSELSNQILKALEVGRARALGLDKWEDCRIFSRYHKMSWTCQSAWLSHPSLKEPPFFKPGVVEGEDANPAKSMLSFYAKITNSHSPPKEGKISQSETEPWCVGMDMFPGKSHQPVF